MNERIEFLRTSAERLQHSKPQLLVVERPDGKWVAAMYTVVATGSDDNDALRKLELAVADRLKSQTDHDIAVAERLREAESQ